MKYELHTEIEIEASPGTVWGILTDFDRYEDWNPFIVSSSGKAVVGEKLTNRLQPVGGKAMTFKPTVTEVSDQKSLEWLGRLGLPGLFDGRHRFDLEPTGSGSRLVHREFFHGILVRVLRKSLDSQTRPGFELMNEALKARAEASDGGAS